MKAKITLTFKKAKKEDPENHIPANFTAIPGKVVGQLVPETISKYPQFPQIKSKSRSSAVGREGGQTALEVPDHEQCGHWPG